MIGYGFFNYLIESCRKKRVRNHARRDYDRAKMCWNSFYIDLIFDDCGFYFSFSFLFFPFMKEKIFC